ncbi:MAG: replication protein RepA [Methylococcaceae bacterium]
MDVENNNTRKKKSTIGNGCGHDPENPRFFKPPEKHSARPGVLRQLALKIREYYADPRKTIPSLDLANGSDRQQRSERREACLALLGCIIHYTDLVTLRVGIPQPNGSMAGLTMPFLAELSGLSERRAERAIHDLKAAGIVTVHAVCAKLEDATYKGFAAIRTVTAKLFSVFGLGRWLKHEREKASERRRKRQRKQELQDIAKVQLSLNAAAGPKHPAKADPPREPERKNKFTPAAEFFANLRTILGTKGNSS